MNESCLFLFPICFTSEVGTAACTLYNADTVAWGRYAMSRGTRVYVGQGGERWGVSLSSSFLHNLLDEV